MAPGNSHLKQFLNALPQGITSYPECRATAVLYQRIVADHPSIAPLCAHPQLTLAPGAVRQDHDWIPLTVQVAAVLALIDLHQGSVARAQQQLQGYGKAILSTGAYKLVFYVLSPMLIVLGVSSRYGRDFRGVKAVAHDTSRTAGKLTLSFPPHLYPSAYVAAYNGIFEAALACGGAKEVKSRVEWVEETKATSAFTWM